MATASSSVVTEPEAATRRAHVKREERMAAVPASIHAWCGNVDRSSSSSGGSDCDGGVFVDAAMILSGLMLRYACMDAYYMKFVQTYKSNSNAKVLKRAGIRSHCPRSDQGEKNSEKKDLVRALRLIMTISIGSDLFLFDLFTRSPTLSAAINTSPMASMDTSTKRTQDTTSIRLL
ncbi:hypothetical protein EJB05_09577, partial [Eragrostis curvula]